VEILYQPEIPERFSAENMKALAPNDPARTLVEMHQSIPPLAKAIDDARAAIDGDPTLSAAGKVTAKEKVFADTVGATVKAHSQPLRLAALRHGEQTAALQKAAVKSATVNPSRSLSIAEHLRDLDPATRNQKLVGADSEAQAAIADAPAIFGITTPAQRQRALDALVEGHDPAQAAELRDRAQLIQAIHESHESLARYGRDKLGLKPAPAKAA